MYISRRIERRLCSYRCTALAGLRQQWGTCQENCGKSVRTVTQGELEVVSPGYVFNTIGGIKPGEGELHKAHVLASLDTLTD